MRTAMNVPGHGRGPVRIADIDATERRDAASLAEQTRLLEERLELQRQIDDLALGQAGGGGVGGVSGGVSAGDRQIQNLRDQQQILQWQLDGRRRMGYCTANSYSD